MNGQVMDLPRCSASWGICESLFDSPDARFNPRMYRMIFDIVRFNLFATELLKLEGKANEAISIGEYLDSWGYSDAFKQDYLLVSPASMPR